MGTWSTFRWTGYVRAYVLCCVLCVVCCVLCVVCCVLCVVCCVLCVQWMDVFSFCLFGLLSFLFAFFVFLLGGTSSPVSAVGQVLEFESRLWGTLATLPAPPSMRHSDAGAADADASGHTLSLMDVLLHPDTPTPRIASDVTADTLTADARAGVLSTHPVWAAVAAAVHGLAENYAASA